jgi:3-oxoacyl-[acyl-carrier-protein] synthase-1
MSDLPADTVVVTGLGMCTSLGGTVTACAAARAGMSAGTELPDLLVRDVDGAEAPATGHPVPTVAGFQGSARLLCLAWPALEELLESTNLRAHAFDRTGLLLGLADPASRPAANGSAGRSVGPGLLSRLIERTRIDIAESHSGHLDEGRTSVIRAVADAGAKLRTGEWHRALIGGVDSLLDGPAVAWLTERGVLKTRIKPDGAQPGEAAAFFLLERLDMARRRGAEPLAVMGAACLATETVAAEPRPPSSGAALAEAASRVLGADGRKPWLVSDHNGEYRRGSELGSALARLAQRAPALAASRRWLPAESFGDTGAAAVAIAACLAARAFTRGYAAGAAAILVASEDGRAGALRLDGPERGR